MEAALKPEFAVEAMAEAAPAVITVGCDLSYHEPTFEGVVSQESLRGGKVRCVAYHPIHKDYYRVYLFPYEDSGGYVLDTYMYSDCSVFVTINGDVGRLLDNCQFLVGGEVSSPEESFDQFRRLSSILRDEVRAFNSDMNTATSRSLPTTYAKETAEEKSETEFEIIA